MASQELRTQLVFEAANAIKNAEALHGALKKIARVDFSKLAAGFGEISKSLKEMVSDVAVQSEKAAKVAQSAAEKAAAAEEKARVRAAKAEEAALIKAAKVAEDAQKKKLKAVEEEADAKQKMQSLTLKLIEQENKAVERLKKKLLEPSDFVGIQRRLGDVAAQVDKVSAKLKGGLQTSVAVAPFMNYLKRVNDDHVKEAIERTARAQLEADEKVKNLFRQHAAKMWEISDKYTQNPKVNLEQDKRELIELTRDTARLSVELGKVAMAASYFRQAFDLSKGRKEFAGLVEEIQKFRQAQKISKADWDNLSISTYLERYKGLKKALSADEFASPADAAKLQRLRAELAGVSAELSQIYKNAGDAKTALKYIEEALRVARGNPELQKQYAQEYEGLLTVARGNEAVLAGIRRKIEGTKEWREQQRAMMKQMLADAADEERAANIRYRATQKQIALEDRLGRIRINEQTGKFEGGKPFTEKGLEGVIKQFERWSAELKRLEPWNDKAGNFDAFLNKIKATNAALISEQMTARNAVDQQASYQARGAQLIKEHRALMNKIAGDYTVGKLGDIEKDQQRLVELTRTIGGMYSALGKASTAAAYFKQALNLAGERKEFAALVDEIRLFNRGQKANDTNWKMLGLDSYLERYRLLKKEMQSDSFNETVSKTKLDRYQRELAEVNAELARIYRNTGEAAKGVKHLEEAIELMSGHSRIQKKYKDELADLMTLITQQELALKQTREKVWGTPEWKAAQREKERAQEQQRRQAERQAELDRKADEEKAARYERLARLAGRVAEIQAKVNEKFNAGKAFSEAQFVRLRNELHRLGVEMDHLTGKNVSGYVDYIMNSVKVKNTPQMSSTAKSLSDQYNEVRKRAEEAAQQFAKTRSIADGIRFGAAMNDLKAITAQTEQLNRMLGKTNGLFKYLTELVYRRAVWHFGEGAVNWLLSFPSTILQSFRDVEQAMAGVQQVMPFIEGNPDRTFGETTNLIDIATQYARSVQEVTEGAQLWGRGYAKPVNDADVIRQSLEQTNEVLAEQGIAVEQVTEAMVDYTNEAMAVATTNELVRQSAILATVDNFSMIESVKGLEAVLAAYGLRAKTAAEATLYAGRAVDIITKVAHYGQISAQDLVRGIEATGAAAEQTGISLEFLTALIETGVRNTAKGGADIGNAIKALTVGLYSDKGQKQLQKFGIETTFIDDEGVKRARSAQAIILDIARALQEGSVNSQKMLLAISGGRYQYSKIRSILKDEEEILRMWAEAIESSGFADKQLEIQMNTLNAKIKQFQANVQSLYQTVMDGWFGDVLKTGVELLSSGIKLLENNFNALSAGAATFLSIFAASKIWSIGASVLALVRNLATFRKELQAAGYAGGLLGVLKEGLFASPAAFVNRYRQQTIATTQALTQTERMLTAEEQRQITVQAAMIRGVAEVIAIRSRESGATAAAAEATRLKTIADEMETAALAKKTAAAGASAAATSAAAEATLAAGAAARVAAAGASLLWGLIFLGIPILVSLAAESDSAAEKLDKLTDATQRAVSEKEKERSSLLQEITQRKKQIELMDQAIDYYIEARRALESYVEGTEDWNKANKRVKNSEEALLIAFRDSNEEGGKEAAKAALARIKASDDIRAAFEKEKASFINGTKEKEEAIKPLDVKLEEFYDKRIVETENIIKMREADIKSFGRWTDAQLEGLDWFQRGYLKFWEFMYNATDSHFWDREGFVGDTVHNFAKRQAIGKGWFGLGLQSELDDWKKQLEDAKQKKAELVSSEVDNALPFEASGIEGAIPDEDDEGGKSKKKKQVVEQYNTVAMRYLAAISEQDKRLNVSDLVAAAGYVRGGDGQTWEQMPFDAVNPLGVNQATLDKYRPNGSLDNPEDVARAFVERLQDFEGSAEEFFTQWYMEIGLAKDAVEA
ncbi:MAG: phage tail tape measure protein, partial [Selenomonadaceae bacterium]|nr:phage tail tape measure protein [Selenomonadaceae bacterium]